MSNNLGKIYATSKSANKYIVLDSDNVEVSGNFYINGTNSRMPAEFENSIRDYLPLTYGTTDSNTTTLFEKFDDLSQNVLTQQKDASFNDVDISSNLLLNDELGGFNIKAFKHDTFGVPYSEDIHSIAFENNYLHSTQTNEGTTNTCLAFGGKTNPLSCVLRAGHFTSGTSNNDYTGFDFFVKKLNDNTNSRRAATIRGAANVSIIENDFYGRLRINGLSVSTSDDRVKHNEKPIINSLDTINKLNPQIYDKTIELKDANYNGVLEEGTYTREAGLIAQEVYEIEELKSFVYEGDDNDKLWSVDYNSINSYHIKATQELHSLVQILQKENTLLKSKLNELLSEAGKETI